MDAFNHWSLFLAGITTGFVLVNLFDRDWTWVAIFGAMTGFNLLMAFT